MPCPATFELLGKWKTTQGSCNFPVIFLPMRTPGKKGTRAERVAVHVLPKDQLHSHTLRTAELPHSSKFETHCLSRGVPAVALWFSLLPVLDPPCVTQTEKVTHYCVMSTLYIPPLLPQLLFSQLSLRRQAPASMSLVTHLFALKFTSYGKNTEKGAMCKILLCGEVMTRRQRNGGSTLLSEELGKVTSVGVL